MTKMNLNNFDTVELTSKEQSEIEGGFLLSALIALVAVVIAIVDYYRS